MIRSVQALFFDVDFARHRLFDSENLDEVRFRSGQVFNPHYLALQDGHRKLKSRLDVLTLGRMSLVRLTWGAPVRVDPGHLDGFYLIVLPLRGQAEFHFDGRSFDVSAQTAAVISPDRRFHFTASDDYEQIVLRLSHEAVSTAWHRLMAHTTPAPISFGGPLPLHGEAWLALQPALQWLTRCAAPRPLPASHSQTLLDGTEELLATTLLLHHAHSESHHFWPESGHSQPMQVRRAQQFMRSHLGEPLAAARVAEHCGLSVRRLQAHFQSACGMSPLQWLRQQRLHAARQALQASQDMRPSISATATGLGFPHLGDFAKAYRAAFGESPRDTLDRRCC